MVDMMSYRNYRPARGAARETIMCADLQDSEGHRKGLSPPVEQSVAGLAWHRATRPCGNSEHRGEITASASHCRFQVISDVQVRLSNERRTKVELISYIKRNGFHPESWLSSVVDANVKEKSLIIRF